MFIENCVSKSLLISLALAVALAGPSLHSQVASVSSDSALTPQAPSSNQPSPNPANPLTVERTHEEVLERHFAVNIIEDQKAIWTSPLHLKKRDLFWLLPSAAILGESLHRDAYLYRALTPAVNTGTRSKTFSDAGVAAFAAGTAGMYLFGRLHGNDHQRETAVLSAEALANSMALGYALKYSLNRERPFNGNGRGDFFVPGGGASFPSSHALAVWSMASVIAHEYPGPLTKLGVYGLATAISVARVTGRQHFPTDVLVGSASGWGIGTITYRRHHDVELPGDDFGRFTGTGEPASAANLGSAEVPLDSWVYSAFDRLAAMGIAQSDFAGVRPWTRLECARLLQEADDLLQEHVADDDARRLVESLRQEFQPEAGPMQGTLTSGLQLDSLYSRVTGISGTPLNDGYHFGQTIYNDYGRPYENGVNAVVGFSGSANHGHWSAYLRGEYQHAPGAPMLLQSTVDAVSAEDGVPSHTSNPVSAVNRLRFLDAYAAFTLDNWQVSFGKQSLWWAPNEAGALILSDNAEPILMLRFSRVTPFTLPSIGSWLGPIKMEFFVGQLGQEFVVVRPTSTSTILFGPGLKRPPFLNGAKISFKPTPNLDLGFSLHVIWGGPGFPITARTFLRSFGGGRTVSPGSPADPGDGDTGFDFRYRIPGLRDWVTLYAEGFSDDEFSPIAYPRRSAWNTGIYLPRIPGVSKLDFRAEGVYTDLPNLRASGSYYWNSRYRSGFTNRGNILGHWIGREGSGFKATSTYWLGAEKTIQASYRNVNVNPDFLGGGRYDDFAGQVNWKLRWDSTLTVSTQYERWFFPILSSQKQSNVTTSVMLTLRPRIKTH